MGSKCIVKSMTNNNREVEKELGGAEVFKEVGRRYRLNTHRTHVGIFRSPLKE